MEYEGSTRIIVHTLSLFSLGKIAAVELGILAENVESLRGEVTRWRRQRRATI